MSVADSHASPVIGVLKSCKSAFWTVGAVSGVVNVLTLTGSLFMLQVYDRVLGSQSIPTLYVLSLIALVAYVFQGGLDYLRTRMLALVGERIDEEVGPRVHAALLQMPLRTPQNNMENLQPLRDLDAVRGFMSSQGPIALFDMPWVPIYLAICFLFHPVIGFVAIGGAMVMIGLTLVTEFRGNKPMKQANEVMSMRNYHAENTQRGAEVLQAMGMLPNLAARWSDINARSLKLQREASILVGSLGAMSKAFRMMLQSLTLGVAAYLAVKGEISPGTIIAATILSAKALAPIDLAVASWKAYVAARQGYQRLTKIFAFFPEQAERFELPPPSRSLQVTDLAVGSPGSNTPIIQRVSFKAEAGQAVGIIGPSASGKSTVARALVGAWRAGRGDVLLDGASISQWTAEDLGPSIGYLPQDVQLFEGTIAENIARFTPNANAEDVIEAARDASFHEFAVAFPEGYDTQIGRGGSHLSAGQKQRLGLARALFGRPFLVVLDEPNANLDAEGEVAVTTAIANVKARGGIAVVIAHRPSALSAVDLLLVMRNGAPVAFGPRDEVLAKTTQGGPRAAPRPDGLKVVGAPTVAEGAA